MTNLGNIFTPFKILRNFIFLAYALKLWFYNLYVYVFHFSF